MSHINLSCVFRIIFRDFQISKITTLLQDHVFPEIIFKLPPKWCIHKILWRISRRNNWLAVHVWILSKLWFPRLRIIQLSKMVQNLFLTIEKVINNITSILKAQQASLNSVARVVVDNHITLDFLPTSQEEFYTTANTSYYVYIL